MAHTDRHDEQWFWHDHHWNKCDGYRRYTDPPVHCDICATEPRKKYWCGPDGKSSWNRECRQAERSKAKHAIRECRDWDDLTIKYHRPYWD